MNEHSPNVILSGGPGAGKTTLLAELAARGHVTVAESARAVIAERLAAGLPPRPSPIEFAQEVLRRDVVAYEACQRTGPPAGWRFFDRGPIDGLGLLQAAGGLPEQELAARLRAFSFHRTVFLLPAWEAIYTTDSERDHPFSHAVRVCDELRAWYARCGFAVHELPCQPVSQRADRLLELLGAVTPAEGGPAAGPGSASGHAPTARPTRPAAGPA